MELLPSLKKDGKIRAIVAMSGGVDSSVAAALLKEAGHDVIGITMHLYTKDTNNNKRSKKTCCFGQDNRDAKLVAEQIGIPHYILNYENRFQTQVIDDFLDTYMRGETPVPCIRCNQKVKFNDLLQVAKSLSGEVLVTGHYVRWKLGVQGPELHQAYDKGKDQSYFLFTTTRDQLAFLRFPLGEITKTETRNQARRFNLEVSEKRESQDICFVTGNNYVELIRKFRPNSFNEGNIIHTDGRILGHHQGIAQFTIGQRRGLKISSLDNTPLYVTKLDAESNLVTVGSKEDLKCNFLILRDTNWLVSDKELRFSRKSSLTVKLRSSQEPVHAKVTVIGNKISYVDLANPIYGVSPGQACIFYLETRVLGGGWIDQSRLI